MANLGGAFNTSDAPPPEEFAPIPHGTKVLMQAIESEIGPTKDGNGTILKITYEVIDEGPYKARRVWDNLNVQNANPTAQNIAQRALADLCEACGKSQIEDSEELHYKPFIAELGIQKGTGTFRDKNVVRKYLKADGSAPNRPAPAGQPATSAASENKPASAPQRSTGSRPWGNRAG